MTTDNCWETFNNVLDAGIDRVILFGPAGTGKTYTAMHAHQPEGGGDRDAHRGRAPGPRGADRDRAQRGAQHARALDSR